ncbi:TIGR04219 family outer membrane beta-barrel protein [uncultured Tolumonas sp.]|uniref:TIGR04219 family outer membrane beta-barrel protein n=1 Tax=uncultured Tolumonas sp. TaxID=263765 RepID=UPI00292D179D|nr:TIGR04219 family outer membrane beta-barrel protein [uncultured Tolumonas sp.]
MNKYSMSLLAAATLVTGAAQADDFSIGGGLDYMYSGMTGTAESQGDFSNSSRWSTFVDFRHPLLMVPNVNFQTSDLSSESANFENKLRTYDFAFYYSPIELEELTLNAGLNFRRYDGTLNHSQDYSNNAVMLYGSAEAPIPGSDFGLFADARVSRWDSDHSHDWKAGVSYNVFPEDTLKFKVRAGYRNMRVDYHQDSIDLAQHTDSWFLGAELRY